MVSPSLLGKTSRLPLYYQLKQRLLDAIERGQFAAGQLLPSERQLQEQYAISRATVRQALSELVIEGVLERQQGIGTRVARRRIAPLHLKLTSFSEEMSTRGLTPGSTLLELAEVPAPARVQERLALELAARLWMVYRLRLADGEPIGLQRLYVPPWLGFGSDDLRTAQSYYGLLARQRQLEVVHAHEFLNARNATAAEARHLSVRPGAALINVQRVAYDLHNRPLEYVELVYRGDRYTYDLTLFR